MAWTSFDRYARYAAIDRAVRASLGPGPRRVLDVGDTAGHLHTFDPELDVVGVDVQLEPLRLAGDAGGAGRRHPPALRRRHLRRRGQQRRARARRPRRTPGVPLRADAGEPGPGGGGRAVRHAGRGRGGGAGPALRPDRPRRRAAPARGAPAQRPARPGGRHRRAGRRRSRGADRGGREPVGLADHDGAALPARGPSRAAAPGRGLRHALQLLVRSTATTSRPSTAT